MYERAPGCQIPNLPDLLIEHIGYKSDGRFIDVGAFDGKLWSNTWPLAELGWKGICFEPHPEHFAKLVVNHDKLWHNVECIPIALSNYIGEAMFYFKGSISTISISQTREYANMPGLGMPIEREEMVAVSTLNAELLKAGWSPGIDLVSIDAEGEDLYVLMGFDLDYWQPRMLIVETHEKYPYSGIGYKGRVIGTMLDFYGFRKVYADNINSIYVSKRVVD